MSPTPRSPPSPPPLLTIRQSDADFSDDGYGTHLNIPLIALALAFTAFLLICITCCICSYRRSRRYRSLPGSSTTTSPATRRARLHAQKIQSIRRQGRESDREWIGLDLALDNSLAVPAAAPAKPENEGEEESSPPPYSRAAPRLEEPRSPSRIHVASPRVEYTGSSPLLAYQSPPRSPYLAAERNGGGSRRVSHVAI